MKRQLRARRWGTAVVEMAVLLPLLLMMICGVWVVGKMVEVHQTLDNACREAARMASQGTIIALTGAYTEIHVDDTSQDIDLKRCVTNTLGAGNYNTAGIIVEFVNLTDAARDEPYKCKKGDRLRITVKLPHDNVRMPVPTGMFQWALPNPDYLTAITEFQSVKDDPFSVNTDLPPWKGY